MEIISNNVKLDLEGKIRNGLDLDEVEKIIMDACTGFGSIPIEMTSRPSTRLSNEVIVGMDNVKSPVGYPKPYKCGREFNLAGLNFGNIVEINGEKPEHDIYVIASILAKLYRIPKNHSELMLLDESLKQHPQFKSANISSIADEKGFILQSYYKLIKADQRIFKNPFDLKKEDINKSQYPTIRQLKIISTDEDSIYRFKKEIITGSKLNAYIQIRPQKRFPGKILEGLRLFTEKNPSVKNSPLGSLKEGYYTEIEIDFKALYEAHEKESKQKERHQFI